MHGTEEASNGGKVKVRIIHGLNISQKNSYTYCKKLEVIKNQVLRACSQGDRLVGKDHCSSPTATHKDAQARYTSCFKFVTQLYPYVHVTGLTNFNISISQFDNYSTSMTLILLPPYLKTIIKHQFFSQYSTHSKESFTNLEHQAYFLLRKLTC